MRIVELQINNLFSYKKANIIFGSYNVIVGANASGKTNIIRILDTFLLDKTTNIDDRRLPRKLKFDKDISSSLRIDISLTKHEARILLELLFNRKIEEDYIFHEDLTNISLNLEWTKIYDDDSPPDTVILYFSNHLTIWKADHSRIHVSYIKSFPETIEDLKSEINGLTAIDDYASITQMYEDRKKFSHRDLFSQRSFQDSLLNGSYSQIKDFFDLVNDRIRLTQNNFAVKYNPASTNEEKEHVVEIFEYMGKKLSAVDTVDLWLLLSRYLRFITILEETRPDAKSLAERFAELKSYDLERYNSINNEFSSIFPNVSFNAQPVREGEGDQVNTVKHIIEFRSKNPFTKQTNTFDLQNSAAGYGEVINLLLEKSQNTESVLVLDEPALRLHPSVIRHLTRMLDASERQIILISHSPFFVDISALGPSRRLLYIKKDTNASSSVFPRSEQGFGTNEPKIKSYIFNPEILFSSHNILVEGPSDAASFYAISDSLNSAFERYNILVVNAMGDGHIDPYVEFMNTYQIPFVAMVDTQYKGGNIKSDNFIILDGKLENELALAGRPGPTSSSIDPDDAYLFVSETIHQRKTERIRNIKLGQIFDKVLQNIGEDPNEIWEKATHR